jgi:hypothetical protein
MDKKYAVIFHHYTFYIVCTPGVFLIHAVSYYRNVSRTFILSCAPQTDVKFLTQIPSIWENNLIILKNKITPAMQRFILLIYITNLINNGCVALNIPTFKNRNVQGYQISYIYFSI